MNIYQAFQARTFADGMAGIAGLWGLGQAAVTETHTWQSTTLGAMLSVNQKIQSVVSITVNGAPQTVANIQALGSAHSGGPPDYFWVYAPGNMAVAPTYGPIPVGATIVVTYIPQPVPAAAAPPTVVGIPVPPAQVTAANQAGSSVSTIGGPQPLAEYIHDVLSTGGYNPNAYDQGLAGDYHLWNEILAAGGLEQICLPLGQRPYADRPWILQPDGGRAFSPTALALVSTFTTTVETTLLSIETPFGYDGVINYIVATILPPSGGGTGFGEGSGSITWRLKANKRHLRDWGNELLSRGSFIDPTPIPNGGLRVYSRNLIELTVTLANGNPLNPNANLAGMIMGWFYPR